MFRILLIYWLNPVGSFVTRDCVDCRALGRWTASVQLTTMFTVHSRAMSLSLITWRVWRLKKR